MDKIGMNKLAVLAIFGLALVSMASIAAADYQAQYGGIGQGSGDVNAGEQGGPGLQASGEGQAQSPMQGDGREGNPGQQSSASRQGGESSGAVNVNANENSAGGSAQAFAETGGWEHSTIVSLGESTPAADSNETIQAADLAHEAVFGDNGVLEHVEPSIDAGEYGTGNAQAAESAAGTGSSQQVGGTVNGSSIAATGQEGISATTGEASGSGTPAGQEIGTSENAEYGNSTQAGSSGSESVSGAASVPPAAPGQPAVPGMLAQIAAWLKLTLGI